MKKIKMTILIILLTANVYVARMANAATVSVENNVNVSANSGGNNASGGEISEGKSTAEVHIESIVNQETVFKIDEVRKSSSGESVEIKVKNSYQNDNASLDISSSAASDLSKSSEVTTSTKSATKVDTEKETQFKDVTAKDLLSKSDKILVEAGDLDDEKEDIDGKAIGEPEEKSETNVEKTPFSLLAFIIKAIKNVFSIFQIS